MRIINFILFIFWGCDCIAYFAGIYHPSSWFIGASFGFLAFSFLIDVIKGD
jgi:hypothetical protein